MKPIAIQIRNLGKSYKIFSNEKKIKQRSLKEDLTALLKRKWLQSQGLKKEERWVLKDLSLDIHQGEIVGIVGSNGAGKSTLLKLVARIMEPTKGRIDIYGRVGALLEVGAGLHGDLSGRENIFLGGAVLGMTRQEILKRFDDIVSFADIGPYLDMPMKRYSSGMYLRLAFSIIAKAHLESEILILDEVLAVGDAPFQKKCLEVMRQLAQNGRTILFVSHNLDSVISLCNRAILLKNGCLIKDGSPSEIATHYNALCKTSEENL